MVCIMSKKNSRKKSKPQPQIKPQKATAESKGLKALFRFFRKHLNWTIVGVLVAFAAFLYPILKDRGVFSDTSPITVKLGLHTIENNSLNVIYYLFPFSRFEQETVDFPLKILSNNTDTLFFPFPTTILGRDTVVGKLPFLFHNDLNEDLTGIIMSFMTPKTIDENGDHYVNNNPYSIDAPSRFKPEKNSPISKASLYYLPDVESEILYQHYFHPLHKGMIIVDGERFYIQPDNYLKDGRDKVNGKIRDKFYFTLTIESDNKPNINADFLVLVLDEESIFSFSSQYKILSQHGINYFMFNQIKDLFDNQIEVTESRNNINSFVVAYKNPHQALNVDSATLYTFRMKCIDQSINNNKDIMSLIDFYFSENELIHSVNFIQDEFIEKNKFDEYNKIIPFSSDSIPYRPMTDYNYPASIE